MPTPPLDAPELYLNRELSWLEFNDRVLREGMSPAVPLLERLKFLAIVSSNLDEFFMIRVAGLRQQKAAGVRRRDPAGLTPHEQLKAIAARVRRMVAEQSAAIAAATAELAEQGISLLETEQFTDEQRHYLAELFAAEIQPALTPLAARDDQPAPVLPGLKLYLALLLRDHQAPGDAEPHLALVPVPDGLPRFLTIPAERRGLQMIRLENLIAAHAAELFPGYRVEARGFFRLTRDADVAVDEEEAADLLATMSEAVRSRRRRAIVRLSVSAGMDDRLLDRVLGYLQAAPADVYPVEGMLDATALMELATRPGFDALKYPDWPPQSPIDLPDGEDLWTAIQERDRLLMHPYESFDPVVRLVEQAADDPTVLAIKQTLYRTSGDSPIVGALVRAAEAGKQVTVLVELKARFDEARNVRWAQRLEQAGCFVIYGIAGYKTHAKLLLIVRREAHRIRRYLHLSTGNYNDKTARLYSDTGLMTAEADLTADAAAFFNLLTGYSQPVGWNRLSIAPTGLRQRLLELIEREIRASAPDRPGLILAKINSLEDPLLIRALYRASQAGVRIRLNVRGICCLRPGVPGVSETIEVTSIIDRFLEHSRIFYFRNGGHEELYLSSADWMVRNVEKRLEVLFPVSEPALRQRLVGVLETCLADNVKARRLRPDGTYEPVETDAEPLRAQLRLDEQIVEANQRRGELNRQFQPLTRPKE